MSAHWTRRGLLARLGAAAALSPFVPLLAGDAEAQSAPRKRLILFFYPNGTNREAYFLEQPPADGSLANAQLSRILEPLDAHKNDLVVLDGVNNYTYKDTYVDEGHVGYMGSMLTGVPILSEGVGSVDGQTYGWASGPSVDQIIVRKTAPATRFPSLEFHVIGMVDHFRTSNRMIYRASRQPITGLQNPAVAFRTIFGSGTGAELRQVQAERRSIIDYLKGDLARVQAKVGQSDRVRLDAHLSSLRAIESQLRITPATTSCNAPAAPAEGAKYIGGGDIYRTVTNQHMAMLVAALACDATRITSLQLGCAGRGGSFPWTKADPGSGFDFSLAGTSEEHGLSHAQASEGLVGATRVERFIHTRIHHMRTLATLIQTLKDTKDASGQSLFANTIVLACSEHGNGDVHDSIRMPFLIAGNAAGAFRTGRYLKFGNRRKLSDPDSGIAHNRVLVSVANAMGVPDSVVGTDKYGAGPIPGLA
jgi:hypothetical protein